MAIADPINPNAIPPKNPLVSDWTCQQWITYYYTLKQALGKKAADLQWTTAWNNQGFWNDDYSWCKYSSAFNKFLVSEGITGESNLIAKTVVAGSEITSNLLDAGTTTAKVLKYAIPVLAIGVLIFGGMVVYNSYVKE